MTAAERMRRAGMTNGPGGSAWSRDDLIGGEVVYLDVMIGAGGWYGNAFWYDSDYSIGTPRGLRYDCPTLALRELLLRIIGDKEATEEERSFYGAILEAVP